MFDGLLFYSPLVNISLDAFGSGEYFPDLVENTDAFYSIRLITIGNWSKYQRNIWQRTLIECDGEEITLGTSFDVRFLLAF